MSEDTTSAVPKPGSADAIDLGCSCPIMDNGRGRGRPDGTFWISGDCPLHAPKGPRHDH